MIKSIIFFIKTLPERIRFAIAGFKSGATGTDRLVALNIASSNLPPQLKNRVVAGRIASVIYVLLREVYGLEEKEAKVRAMASAETVVWLMLRSREEIEKLFQTKTSYI